mgnify:CR=1 FL=1
MRNINFTKWLGLLLFAMMMPVYVSAQNITVKGSVKDATGEPLIGVNVLQVGTTNGVISDFDGNFELNVPSNAKLSFSFIGYKTQTVSVNGKTSLSVILQEDSKTLDEVVVVGYGTMKKSDISGAVTTVNQEAVMRRIPQNIGQALQGAAAGVRRRHQSPGADRCPGKRAEFRENRPGGCQQCQGLCPGAGKESWHRHRSCSEKGMWLPGCL